MKSIRYLHVYVALLLAVCAISALTGCAGKKPPVWGNTESGLILEYRMKPGDVLKYEMIQAGTEKVEVMGQTSESATEKTYVFAVEAKGMDGDNHLLGITVESLAASMKNVQGEFAAETEEVAGASFDMTVSALGDEVDVSGAEPIVYGIGPLGDRSIKSDFEGVFANLAGKPVKVGDSWASTDTINIDQGNAQIMIVSESLHTLDGYETVDGVECARVVADIGGTISGEGEQMGAPLVFNGTMSGTETWYFAYKEGHLVSSSSDVNSDIMVTVQAGQEMKIPIKGTAKFETRLIK